jgi:tetratricopeptide (TPR) repeat protein
LSPRDAGVVAAAAGFASTFGRLDEAIALQKQAQEIDPLSATGLYNLAFRYLAAGRASEAEEALRRLLEMKPEDYGAHRLLGDAHLLRGRAEAALAEYDKELDASDRLAGRAMAQHALGRREASDTALRELVATYGEQANLIATVHAYRGEADEAFAWLERAYKVRDSDLVYLKPTYFLRSLHGDPRWRMLLQRIGLPPD